MHIDAILELIEQDWKVTATLNETGRRVHVSTAGARLLATDLHTGREDIVDARDLLDIDTEEYAA